MASAEGRPAARVASGILVSRLLGFVREAVFARYFGNSSLADAYRAAVRIPNMIRNLLGEGTLSASFIPVYAGLLAKGTREEARRLAGAVVSLLVLVTVAVAAAGIALAPVVTDLVAPGFAGPTRDLTVRLVRILFPMSGVLIVSAWCLGVLNTHGRFFLSYAAPAMWSIAQIAVLLALGARLVGQDLIVALALGAVGGSVLQLAVQLPAAWRLVRGIAWTANPRTPGVGTVVRAWIPVVFGAGVIQISGVIDTQLGSFLGTGAVAVLGYAQLVALLPVSLFGVGIAAAALPDLARDAAGADRDAIRRRLSEGTRHLAFFVFPSAYGIGLLAVPIVATLFQRGQFDEADTALTAGVLAAYAIGLFAQSTVKLFASGFYALGDTRTPVRCAAIGVTLSAGSAIALMQVLGPAGIALGASIGAYGNVGLLAFHLTRRVGPVLGPAHRRSLGAVLTGVTLAAAATALIERGLAGRPAWLTLAAGVAGFSLVYGIVTLSWGHPDARAAARSLRHAAWGGRPAG